MQKESQLAPTVTNARGVSLMLTKLTNKGRVLIRSFTKLPPESTLSNSLRCRMLVDVQHEVLQKDLACFYSGLRLALVQHML
jgi:hypothetical protein